MKTRPRLLIVGSPATAEAVAKGLRSDAYQTVVVHSGKAALDRIPQFFPDLLLIELPLPGQEDGIPVLEQIHSKWHLPVLCIIKGTDDRIVKHTRKTEPCGYLTKPIQDELLNAAVGAALSKCSTEERLSHFRALLRILSRVNRLIVAERDPQVLGRKLCRTLTVSRGYWQALFVLTDEQGKILFATEFRRSRTLPTLKRVLKPGGELPEIMRPAWEHSGTHRVPVPIKSTRRRSPDDTPLMYFMHRLEYKTRIMGVLVVTVPGELSTDPEAQSLFEDLVGNVSFALYSKYLREERQLVREALRASEKKYRDLFNEALDMIHVVDRTGRIVDANRTELEKLGYTREEYIGKRLVDIIHPDFRERTVEQLRRVLLGENIDKYETAFIAKTGEKIDIEVSAFPEFEGGEVVSARAIIRDITERKAAEAELALRARQQAVIAELGQTALLMTDPTRLMEEVVESVAETLQVEYCKVLELQPDGRTLLLKAGVGWKPGLVGTATVSSGPDSQAGFTLISGEPVIVEDLSTETRFQGPPLLRDHGIVSGISVIIQSTTRPYGVLAVHTKTRRIFPREDIHFLQTAANVLALALERKRTEEALKRANRTLKMLIKCNQAVIQAKEESSFLNTVCRIIVDLGGYRLAWVGFAEHDREKTVKPIAQVGYEDGYLDTINITWADTDRGRGPTGTAIRTQKPVICKNILTDPKFTPWRAEAIRRGYASSIALPLMTGRKVLGSLNIYAPEPHAFDDDEVALLEELANDLAYGLRVLRIRAAREAAEQALRESEEKFRGIAEKSLVGIYLIQEGMFKYVNPRCAEIFGYRVSDLVEKKGPYDLTHPDDRSQVEENLRRRLTGEVRAIRYEFRGVRKNGETIEVEVYGARTIHAGKPAVVGTLQDITERKRIEQKLARYREELKQLSARLLYIQEDERKRIARELHDTVGQVLTAMRINLEALKAELPETVSSELMERVIETNSLVEDLLQRTRELALELRPTMLDDLGLVPTLRWYTHQFMQRTHIAVNLEATGLEERLPVELETVLYRTIQEALTNVARHAGATAVRVVLQRRAGRVIAEVEDDGCGFDVTAVMEQAAPETKLGLLGMQERVSIAGGTLWITSAPRKGTRIRIELPLSEAT
jgi:PAS domain S-box-containing protein